MIRNLLHALGNRHASAGIILFFMLLAGALPVDAGAAKGEKNTPGHVFLWSVKGPGCTVYLLGSVHMLSKGSYPLDARMEKAYASCPGIVFEADMDDAGTEKVQAMMLKLGTYPKGQTLRKNLSAKTYGMLEEKCRTSGIEVSRFDRTRPWLVSVMLASINLRKLGISPEDGVDAYLFRKARMDGKKMIFLESAGQQINLLAHTLSNRQEELLRQTLEELDVVKESSLELENAWRRGDAARVEAISKTSLKGYPDIARRLFSDRNAAWTSKIEKLLMEKEDVLVVVGAAHLVGNDGVLELLKRKGYEPVQN